MELDCLSKDKKKAKYVIKCLQAKTKGTIKHLEKGLKDLTNESKILSSLSHPNIIKAHGFSKYGLNQHDYFIILEKLDCTFREKLDQWNKSKKKIMVGKMNKLIGSKKFTSSLKDKLSMYRDFASALVYLHSHRIVHRDLKPSNLCFNCNGEVKIIDFGLAAELRCGKKKSNGLYCLTGDTGTRRYMAPEIVRKEPYNESVDIYSFSLILWEMLAMTKPFEDYDIDMFDNFVADKGDRLYIDETWPAPLQRIISRCWAHNCFERMSAHELFTQIQNIVDVL